MVDHEHILDLKKTKEIYKQPGKQWQDRTTTDSTPTKEISLTVQGLETPGSGLCNVAHVVVAVGRRYVQPARRPSTEAGLN